MSRNVTRQKPISKINKILQQLGAIDTDQNDNSLLVKLTQPPKKETKTNTPSVNISKKDAIHQIDLLMLPEDNGYKYCLTVVDLATNEIDCEALKNKESNTVSQALETIYKRKILNVPQIIECDQGTEFKGDFATHWNKKSKIRYKLTGRHRSQSKVEYVNGLLGKIIMKRQLAQEMRLNVTSKEWVKDLKKIVELLNENFSHEEHEFDGLPRCTGTACDLLEIGQKVRPILDYPQKYITGERLHGDKFRQGDIRWNRKVSTIKNILILPDQPPMYVLDNLPDVGYTKGQLQVVTDNEVLPSISAQRVFEMEKVLQKKKQRGKTMYLIKWVDGDETWETEKKVQDAGPWLIEEFNNK